MANSQQKQPEQGKVKLTVSQILEDLSNGIDRKGIRTKYNLSATDVARLFQHEKLKGARVKAAPAFELEDDTAEEDLVQEKRPAAKKSSKAKEVAPAAAQGESQEGENEAQEEQEQEVVAEATPSGQISEVQTEEDNVELTDDTAAKDTETSKKGLW